LKEQREEEEDDDGDDSDEGRFSCSGDFDYDLTI